MYLFDKRDKRRDRDTIKFIIDRRWCPTSNPRCMSQASGNHVPASDKYFDMLSHQFTSSPPFYQPAAWLHLL